MGELEAAMRKAIKKDYLAEGIEIGELKNGIATVERMLKKSESLAKALEYADISEDLWNKYKALGSIDALIADIKSKR